MSPHDAVFAHGYNASFISKPLTSWQMDAITKNFLDHCNEGVKK
jgi:esterase/lipase superfamily enzyme